ncbi:MAG: hypothetical protein JO297_18875, partial [Nitrososphaeraceae archaeon]|nr:hypothetical protein [Nitrososphaeraceae archaeon]
MGDTLGEELGVPNNEEHSTPKDSGKDTIALAINDTLQKEQILTSFTVKACCIIVGLNHKYDKKTIVSSIYKDWNKTIKSFSDCARKKGINNNHILMLIDVLDNNWERIIDIQQQGEEERKNKERKFVSRELKQKKKVVEEVKKLKSDNKNITFDEWKAKLVEKYQILQQVVQKEMPEIWVGLEFELSVLRVLNIHDCTLPFIGILLGPPSSYKTAIIGRLKQWPNTFFTDNFTAKSFVSHTTSVKTEEELREIDLLPKLKNNIFLTPELSPTFTAKDEDLHVILGIITRVADGQGLSSDSGAHGHRGYDEPIMFTWIGAAVDVPRKVYKLLGNLGAKLYFLRLPSVDRTEQDLSLEDNKDAFNVRYERIKNALTDYLEWFEINPYATTVSINNNSVNEGATSSKSGDDKEEQLQPSQLQLIKVEADRKNDKAKALECIRRLAILLAHLRQPAITWDSKEGQGSDYAYSVSLVENADRAYTLLKNVDRGHALLTGRNYLAVEDVPLLIKIVLSTAHIDRVKIFDLLLNHNGVLNTNIIMQSLNVSKPTALKTMLELKVIGLVDKSEDVYDENVNNKVRHIYLNKERYGWFLTDDFRKLREGFIPIDYNKT